MCPLNLLLNPTEVPTCALLSQCNIIEAQWCHTWCNYIKFDVFADEFDVKQSGCLLQTTVVNAK